MVSDGMAAHVDVHVQPAVEASDFLRSSFFAPEVGLGHYLNGRPEYSLRVFAVLAELGLSIAQVRSRAAKAAA